MGIIGAVVGVLTIIRMLWKPVLVCGLATLVFGTAGAMAVANTVGTITVNGTFVFAEFVKVVGGGITDHVKESQPELQSQAAVGGN